MFTSAHEIRHCLERLGEKLEGENCPALSILICGGSALSLSGLVSRTTADVDSLGMVLDGKKLVELPEWLLALSRSLATEMGMEQNWLNDAPFSLQVIGLPEGILQRSASEKFGARLEVMVASRIDLVALDPQSGARHLSDLVDIAPSAEEFSFTASWLLGRRTSPSFRKALARLFAILGEDSVE